MDFSSRSAQTPAAAPSGQASAPGGSSGKKNRANNDKWTRVGVVLAVAALVIILVAAIVASVFGGVKAESSYVETSKLQAVFLNTGQVYFGNIKELNSKIFVVTNIYYLQTTSNGTTGSTSNANVTLVKLGCELHEPFDQMVINRDQVTFWENLQDNGQVAKAVKTFEQQNPNGQKCADQSSSASTNSGNNAQNAGSSSSSSGTNSNSSSTSGR